MRSELLVFIAFLFRLSDKAPKGADLLIERYAYPILWLLADTHALIALLAGGAPLAPCFVEAGNLEREAQACCFEPDLFACPILSLLLLEVIGIDSFDLHHAFGEDAQIVLDHQLGKAVAVKNYALRSTDNAFITNISSYDRQHPYSETEFFEFDRYLFSTWQNKRNGKGKDSLPWGVPID